MARRVVVSGVGVVSPLADGVKQTWQRLVKGDCGVSRVTSFNAESFPAKIAASVPRGKNPGEFDADRYVPLADKRKASPFIEFALGASEQALVDSGLTSLGEEEKIRSGVCIGTGIGCISDLDETSALIRSQENGHRKVSPFFIPRILGNMAAGLVSIRWGLKGPNHSVITACASGAHSIGDAYRFIKYGDADMMVAGGTESCIGPMSFAGFCKLKALSTKFNDNPDQASRPFDKDRDGFVMGEGSGVLVLEEYEAAKRRGAKIYCEIVGYGLSGDSHHITAPPSDGDGAFRAMKNAIKMSGLNLEDIGYINAHATSTPLGDAIENAAITNLFGDSAKTLAISSTKGSIGHLLGAAGAVEAIFSIIALQEGIVPPTLNLRNPDEGFNLNYVPNVAQEKKLSAVMSNSFGFGGTNACLIFKKLE